MLQTCRTLYLTTRDGFRFMRQAGLCSVSAGRGRPLLPPIGAVPVCDTITARWARGEWGRAGRGHARDGSSLGCMVLSWDNSRRAFTDAADWFVRTAALVGDRWGWPGRVGRA